MPETYAVMMRDDDGYYILASRRYWTAWEDAKHYADTIAHTRLPIIVRGLWGEMRQGEPFQAMCAVLRADNPNFDRARFLAA